MYDLTPAGLNNGIKLHCMGLGQYSANSLECTYVCHMCCRSHEWIICEFGANLYDVYALYMFFYTLNGLTQL